MSLRLCLILAVAVFSSSIANGQTISTEFATTDGFVTGSSVPVTLSADDFSFDATILAGTQQQSFDGPAYSGGSEALFFISGNFQGSFGNFQSGTTGVGNISFSTGVDNVSFFAANRGIGTPTYTVIGVDGSLLQAGIPITSLANDGSATPIVLDSSTLGQQIDQIVFSNTGPGFGTPDTASVIAIDSFTASVNSVPEPTSAGLIGLVSLAVAFKRRRKVIG